MVQKLIILDLLNKAIMDLLNMISQFVPSNANKGTWYNLRGSGYLSCYSKSNPIDLINDKKIGSNWLQIL